MTKRDAAIARHYRLFSPLHRETALLALDDFSWLTPDRKVQRTVFGGGIEMIANFGDAPYVYENVRIPVGAIACHLKSGEIEVFVPAAN